MTGGDFCVLQLREKFGRHPKRPWVARITAADGALGLVREFVDGRRDYRHATRSGRGVIHCYYLRPGIYEICEPRTWRRSDRYFARCAGGKMDRIQKPEIERFIGE